MKSSAPSTPGRTDAIGAVQVSLPNGGSLIDVTLEDLQVRLLRGKRSRVSYLYKKDRACTLTMSLFYKCVSSSDTQPFRLARQLYRSVQPGRQHRSYLNNPATPLASFDAKYRLDSVELETGGLERGRRRI